MTIFEDIIQAPEFDPNKDYFSDLVGEGKKFKDQQALAYSKEQSDLHVKRLENEMAELRKDLKARTTLAELTDRWAQMQTKQADSHMDDVTQQRQMASDNSLTPETVENLFDSKISKYLSEHEQKQMQQRNASVVKEELKKVFGDSYSAKVKSELNKIGMSEEDANDLAMRNPSAFMRLVSPIKSDDRFSAPPKSSITPTFTPSNKERTMSYYEDIRKTQPNLYWTPKFQNQLHDDAVRLGERFFDTE